MTQALVLQTHRADSENARLGVLVMQGSVNVSVPATAVKPPRQSEGEHVGPIGGVQTEPFVYELVLQLALIAEHAALQRVLPVEG